jgi:hypothetical protein
MIDEVVWAPRLKAALAAELSEYHDGPDLVDVFFKLLPLVTDVNPIFWEHLPIALEHICGGPEPTFYLGGTTLFHEDEDWALTCLKREPSHWSKPSVPLHWMLRCVALAGRCIDNIPEDLQNEVFLSVARGLSCMDSCDIRFFNGYTEPGYDKEVTCVVTGDWNQWGALGDVIGLAKDIEIGWCDEWAECCSCQKAVRTEPNSYSWRRSYVENNGEVVCVSCILDDERGLSDILIDEFVNQPQTAITFDIPAKTIRRLGWVVLDHKYESGWHPGQNDSPQGVSKVLSDAGIDHWFWVNDVGQFDISFKVVVKRKKQRYALAALRRGESQTRLPEDPGTVMARGLKSIDHLPAKPGHIQVTKVVGDTSETKYVSHEDFIAGKALE